MSRSILVLWLVLSLLPIGCQRQVAVGSKDEWMTKAQAQWTGPIDINKDGTLELVYSIDGKRIVDSGGYCLCRNF